MIVTVQPNTFTDITTLASLDATAAVSIEYDSGAVQQQSVFLALLAAAPTDDAAAQAKLICDETSFRCVRTIQGETGKSIYAWHRGSSPIKLLIG